MLKNEDSECAKMSSWLGFAKSGGAVEPPQIQI